MADQQALLSLQRLDTTIDQARHRRAHLSEQLRLDQSIAALAALEASRAGLLTESAAQEAIQTNCEREVAEFDRRLREIDKRAKVVTTAKEATALEHERDGLLNRRGAIEDAELAAMEILEDLSPKIADLEERIATTSDERDVAVRSVEIATAEVESELMRLSSERDAVAASLDAATLANYDRVRSQLRGVAVATIEHGVCSGCRLQIPAVELDRIRHQPPDALVNCEQCGRLLVR